MLVSDVIKSSLRKLGAISLGESLEDDDDKFKDTLMALQVMLRDWAQKRIYVYATTKESYTLVVSQNSYTWGLGGDINTARPHSLVSAFIRDSNGLDIPIMPVSEGSYDAVQTKSSETRPMYINYLSTYPNGLVRLYPTPAVAETLWLTSLKPFVEESSFLSAGDTLDFPPNYQKAIIYNLAMEIAPELSISPSPETVNWASTSLYELISMNASLAMEPVEVVLPVRSRIPYYNIHLGR